MSTRHTPGPWEDDDVEGSIAIAAVSDGEVLAYLAKPHQQTNARSPDETAANGRLIAAAPELLESLLSAVTALELLIDVEAGSPAAHTVAKARAAIAKAIGSAE